MPTGPEVFLGMPSVSGQRSCTRTHLKKTLCHTRLVGGTEDKYQLPPSRVERMQYSLRGAGLGRISVDRVLLLRRSGRVCPGSSGSRSRGALTVIVKP